MQRPNNLKQNNIKIFPVKCVSELMKHPQATLAQAVTFPHEWSFRAIKCRFSAKLSMTLLALDQIFSIKGGIIGEIAAIQICAIAEAARAPGPQVMPPPGWEPLPHRYSPMIGV